LGFHKEKIKKDFWWPFSQGWMEFYLIEEVWKELGLGTWLIQVNLLGYGHIGVGSSN